MQFLYPNVLFLLLFLGVLIFLLATNKNNMERFFKGDTLNKLLVSTNALKDITRNILFFMILILFILALSRPVMDIKEQTIKQKLIPIVIALDVSKSMWATDIYPSRLDLAKKKLKEIIKLSNNTTIGIVLFAKNSYIVSPITEDFTSLNYIVDNLDTNLNFANGSNIFAVLDATSQMLIDYKVKNLIILSDGGNDNEYSKELDFAKENKIAIYTVGLATSQGAPIPDKDSYLTNAKGEIVTVSLNESIKNLALNSGGGYIDFSLANEDIQAIMSQIQTQSKKEEISSKKIKTYTELFYYPLALAVLLLLIVFSSLPKSKNHILSFIILFFTFYPTSGFSGMLDFEILKEAKDSYVQKDYQGAIESYQKIKDTSEANYNLANSYYKNKEYKKAIENYSKIITSNKELEYKKLHNLGNSYVQEKNLEKAKEFYEKALKLKDDKTTQENLEIVKKEIKKQKKDKKKKKNKDKKNKDKKKQEPTKEPKKDNKEEDKNKKDKKDEDEYKKNQDQLKKKKEDKEKKKQQNSKDGENKKKNDEKGKEKVNTKQAKPSQEDISDMEEKKWLKALQKKKAPIMLQQVKSKKQSNKNEQPW